MLSDAYKQGQTRVMLPNIWRFAEPLLISFGCVTTTQEVLITKVRLPESNQVIIRLIHPIGAPLDLGKQPPQLTKFLDKDEIPVIKLVFNPCVTKRSHSTSYH